MPSSQPSVARPDPTADAPASVQIEPGRRRADAAPRPDLYLFVHKGLRAFLGATLDRCGCLDSGDSREVAQTLGQVRELLVICRAHLDKEEQFLHPALEARRPGAARQTAREHAAHLQAFEDLEGSVRAVEQANGAERAAAALRLYRRLALFVAENLEHMHVEETANNEALWATHGDEELLALQAQIVGAIPPEQMAVFQRWMIPAMTPGERAVVLTGLKQRVPAEAFSATLGRLKLHLAERDWNKLMAALAGL